MAKGKFVINRLPLRQDCMEQQKEVIEVTENDDADELEQKAIRKCQELYEGISDKGKEIYTYRVFFFPENPKESKKLIFTAGIDEPY